MKKYALYPGRGKVTPDGKLTYVTGRQLAACYRVPYSECLDTDIPAIRKVMTISGAAPVYLTHLLPSASGKYKLPGLVENRIILANELHKQVEKNG